jgi:hypothetical protein
MFATIRRLFGFSQEVSENLAGTVAQPRQYPPSYWRIERHEPSEVEHLMSLSREDLRALADSHPFLWIPPPSREEWEVLRSKYEEGDEYWSFSAPASYWKGMAGRAGITLVRNGVSVADIETVCN